MGYKRYISILRHILVSCPLQCSKPIEEFKLKFETFDQGLIRPLNYWI